jgi:hypothetical protein
MHTTRIESEEGLIGAPRRETRSQCIRESQNCTGEVIAWYNKLGGWNGLLGGDSERVLARVECNKSMTGVITAKQKGQLGISKQ